MNQQIDAQRKADLFGPGTHQSTIMPQYGAPPANQGIPSSASQPVLPSQQQLMNLYPGGYQPPKPVTNDFSLGGAGTKFW